MVRITSTEDLSRKRSLEKKLIEEFFKELGRVKIDTGGYVHSERGGMPVMNLLLSPYRITVYDENLSDEKLLAFGEEYEAIFGVKDIEIIKDYSRRS